ncbi:uncharacterized protein MONOS_13202 [Monocercomonoides exilis]|uniref:uncharacterized protein n=1 Tax=Monocercomonoides exilis TaxID=2049356 RepID=UPI00355A4574|nr:hypothetical protein MONOS_13202 [Monocercomonoides exilis]|eukprot:MONOS_13202.1-p1 / transcript=MONOS_13202.1 / gene=MONOS_13202 / organism=Monocercomonoides_exilis_PA203 / gene_product=unspecified product / transcript_product=unspecified product / location=Mono_scaffold00790:10040-10261(-) / protein_length=74 / sequence_SO=supercontig / SO=protein_coding / is_pseudo=false
MEKRVEKALEVGRLTMVDVVLLPDTIVLAIRELREEEEGGGGDGNRENGCYSTVSRECEERVKENQVKLEEAM